MPDVVLFIHSTGTGPSMWRPLVEALPDGFEARTPPNLGYPPRPPHERGEPYTVDADVELLVDVVKDVRGPLHVVAHSYGGLVAYRLARQRPVTSFWFYEPVLFGALRQEPALNPEAKSEVDYVFGNTWFLDDEERGGRDAWLEFFIDYWNRPGSFSRMPPPLKDAMRALGWKMFQEVRATARDPAPFAAHETSIPTTLMMGERTTAAARAMAHALAAQGSAVRLETMPDATHMSIVLQGQRFAPSFVAHVERERGA